MATVAKIANASLKRILVAGDEADYEPSEYQDYIFALNNYMLALDAEGISLGYTEVSDIGDEVTVPVGALRGIIANMAIEVAPDYNGQVSPGLMVAAKAGMDAMRKLGQRMPTSSYPSTLPIGSGNYDNGYIDPFYPDAEAEILSETTGAIGLEVGTNSAADADNRYHPVDPVPPEVLPYIISVTMGNDESLYLPLPENGYTSGLPHTYNFTVDWGDGSGIDTITSFDQAERVHLYSAAGTYTVTIDGICEGWSFDAVSTSAQKIVDVIQWGNIGITDFTYAFYECDLLVDITATDGPDLSACTSLRGMFDNSELATCSFLNWDVSGITNFNSIFNQTYIAGVGIDSWDIGAATDVAFMFAGTLNFNADIGLFDVSNVTDFNGMLQSTQAFDQDISGWDVSAAANLTAFMSFSTGFSTGNYDLLLNGWSSLTFTNTGLTPTFNNSYTIAASQAARDILTGAPNNWTITDLGGI